MTIDALSTRFEKIGASLAVMESKANRFWTNTSTPDIDVRSINKSETFVINNFDNPDYNFEVLDLDQKKRHLLLMMKRDTPAGKERRAPEKDITKFLCGHDETHWFVAAIPESAHAKNIEDAMEALKPEEVQRASQILKPKHKNKRRNKAWKRQGEWFFIPMPFYQPSEYEIIHNEPIQRDRSKPHMCEDMVRAGGTALWFHWRHAPAGVNEFEMEQIKKRVGDYSGWQARVADAVVYVRGNIRHPDHTTLHLDTWCRVVMNEEAKAKARANLRFLD